MTLAVLGFLLTTQLRAQENLSRDLRRRNVDELASLAGTLSQENERLTNEMTDLRLILVSSRQAGESEVTQIIEQRSNVAALQVLTGVVRGTGRGVRIEIKDPKGVLQAYDLAQLANELRSAGAEALVLNGRRLDFRTAFIDRGAKTVIGGTELHAPYVFEAIGEPDYIVSSLVMAGGVAPALEGRPGVEVEIEKRGSITVPRLEKEAEFRFAAKSER